MMSSAITFGMFGLVFVAIGILLYLGNQTIFEITERYDAQCESKLQLLGKVENYECELDLG